MLICSIFPGMVDDDNQPLPKNIPMMGEQEDADPPEFFRGWEHSGSCCHWTTPRIMHYISFFHYISFALHLKILPRQHEMHDMSRFKCHALHLHFMK